MNKTRSPPAVCKRQNRQEEENMINNNDYSKYYFWRKKDTKGNTHYYFKINGTYVEVSKDVFTTCYNSYKQQERYNKISGQWISLNDETSVGNELIDKIADKHDGYEMLYQSQQVKDVMNVIDGLNDEDKNLITNLLIKNKTERELSKQMKVSQAAINKRKKKIINKIREKSGKK